MTQPDPTPRPADPLDLDRIETPAEATAERIVSLWVNNRGDRGACILNDRLLGAYLPDACRDLVERIRAALEDR